ncbi:MAG TPA: transcription antitermination protein NusB [Patescibacteria group bacterium]
MVDDLSQTTPDPRHQKRMTMMQKLFSSSFYQNLDLENLEEHLVEIRDILEKIPELDASIQNAAPERPLTEINKVDLAILRLVVFESTYKKTPKKVLINEGVELAKEFGTESSPRFVNAVLGKVLLPSA